MPYIEILLADDHNVVRSGLRTLLEAEPGFRLVGEAADGLEVLPLVEKLKPDVVVLDIKMPGMNGLDVAQQVTSRVPETNVVMLSMYSDEAYVVQALRNGAAAYVLKESRATELLTAIHEVSSGRRYLSPPLSERSIESYLQKAHEAELDPYDSLSPREREVLHLSAQGLRNPDVGEKLGISARTVETHRSNMMKKLALKNQTDLVRFAIRRGLIPDA